MENRDKIASLIQDALNAVNRARGLAPGHCNLSDDLESVADTLDNLQSSVHCNEYDSEGMAI